MNTNAEMFISTSPGTSPGDPNFDFLRGAEKQKPGIVEMFHIGRGFVQRKDIGRDLMFDPHRFWTPGSFWENEFRLIPKKPKEEHVQTILSKRSLSKDGGDSKNKRWVSMSLKMELVAFCPSDLPSWCQKKRKHSEYDRTSTRWTISSMKMKQSCSVEMGWILEFFFELSCVKTKIKTTREV